MAGAKDWSKMACSPNRRTVVSWTSPVLLLALLATGLGGCMLAALPLAINAAEAVGSAVANVTVGAVVAAHQGKGPTGDQEHPGESEMDREDRCEELQTDVPDVIELHKGAAGAEYRELHLGGSLAKPQWVPVVERDTNAAGWRPAVNFLHMDFTPPLGPLPGAGSAYLAYRPMQSDTAGAPQVEFAPLSANFGKAAGTFHWKGTLYEYALASALPCFSTDALKP